jgi:hypothetical protein
MSSSSVFSGVRVTLSLVLYVCLVDRCLSCNSTFSFGHCVVCPSLNYRFWLPLWYHQALLVIFIIERYSHTRIDGVHIIGMFIGRLWGLRLLCLMSTICSTIFQLYCGRSVFLVEEIVVPTENHWPAASHWQTLSHKCGIELHLTWVGFELTTLVVIGTDCIGSYKSIQTYVYIHLDCLPMT